MEMLHRNCPAESLSFSVGILQARPYTKFDSFRFRPDKDS